MFIEPVHATLTIPNRHLYGSQYLHGIVDIETFCPTHVNYLLVEFNGTQLRRQIGSMKGIHTSIACFARPIANDLHLGKGKWSGSFTFLVSDTFPPTLCTSYAEVEYTVTLTINYNNKVRKDEVPVYLYKNLLNEQILEYPTAFSGKWRDLVSYHISYPSQILFEKRSVEVYLDIVPKRATFVISNVAVYLVQTHRELKNGVWKKSAMELCLLDKRVSNALFGKGPVHFAPIVPGFGSFARQLLPTIELQDLHVSHHIKTRLTVAEKQGFSKAIASHLSHVCPIRLYTEGSEISLEGPPEYKKIKEDSGREALKGTTEQILFEKILRRPVPSYLSINVPN